MPRLRSISHQPQFGLQGFESVQPHAHLASVRVVSFGVMRGSLRFDCVPSLLPDLRWIQLSVGVEVGVFLDLSIKETADRFSPDHSDGNAFWHVLILVGAPSTKQALFFNWLG